MGEHRAVLADLQPDAGGHADGPACRGPPPPSVSIGTWRSLGSQTHMHFASPAGEVLPVGFYRLTRRAKNGEVGGKTGAVADTYIS